MRPGESNPNWRGGPRRFTCEICQVEFGRYGKQKARFCGRKCRAAWDSARTGESHPKWLGGLTATARRYKSKRNHKVAAPRKSGRPCPTCGERGVRKGAKFHPKCRPFKSMVFKPCVDCGAVRRMSADRVYERCGKCAAKKRGGENNANWKGGVTSANQKIRASNEYKSWRISVFERDRYTCVMCGQRGGNLHADHIQPFATHPGLRLDINNGRTLCVPCHMKTPTFLGGTRRLLAQMKRAQRNKTPDLPFIDGARA